jgi:hypothetical protein
MRDRSLPVMNDIDSLTFLFEAPFDKAGHLLIVFNYKDSHGVFIFRHKALVMSILTAPAS